MHTQTALELSTGHVGDVEATSILMPPHLLRCQWPPNAGVMPGDSRFDAILASIREYGIRKPLVINLEWFVIDGNHRLAAARLLGLTRVPVRIWTGVEFVPQEATRD